MEKRREVMPTSDALPGQRSSFPLCCLVTDPMSDPMDCSPPGSSVHGVSQARILERAAIFSSKGSPQPRDRTRVSYTGSGCHQGSSFLCHPVVLT